MVMKKCLFLLVCVVVMGTPSYAQRLIPGQKGMEITGSLPVINGEKLFRKDHFGVGISFTRYLKSENYTFLAAEYEQQDMAYRSYRVPMKDAFLQVGYMHPVLVGWREEFLCLCGYFRFRRLRRTLPGENFFTRRSPPLGSFGLRVWRRRASVDGAFSDGQSLAARQSSGTLMLRIGCEFFSSRSLGGISYKPLNQ